jgi:DtxR family Mn-dependent transcriptional regulator
MGFDLRESHERALLIQPTVDEVFEDKLDAMLDHPTVDPHGRPIPSKNMTWPRMADSPLLDLPAGCCGTISRITSEDGEAIKYLETQGLRAGTPLTLESVSPFDGPIAVRIGRRSVHLGRRLAQLVHLENHSRQSAKAPKGRRDRSKVLASK